MFMAGENDKRLAWSLRLEFGEVSKVTGSHGGKLTFGRVVISDVLNGVADDLLVVHVRLGCDFSAQQDHSGLADSL